MLVQLEHLFGKIMKNLCLIIILPFIGFAQVKKDTVLVYFLGGQSNMQGYGFNKDLRNELKKEFKDVYIFQGNNVEDNKPNAGLGIWDNLKPGHGTDFSSDGKTNKLSDRFGIELSFAKKMQEINPKQKIAIIKYSRNGSSIDISGAPYFGTWDTEAISKTGKNQFDYFLKTVNNALSVGDINNDGIQDVLVPAGILWMQGESDANNEEVANRYFINLKKLMDLMLATFRNNNLPIVIGKISDSGDDKDGKVWDFGELVQYAQEKYVRNQINVAIVRSTSNYKYSDKYHYDSTGYLDLGIQFANTLKQLSKSK